jgi:hypothetical protein
MRNNSGYVSSYLSLTVLERKNVAEKFAWPGLAQSKETTEWLWKSQFSAVAADSPAFECTRMFFSL